MDKELKNRIMNNLYFSSVEIERKSRMGEVIKYRYPCIMYRLSDDPILNVDKIHDGADSSSDKIYKMRDVRIAVAEKIGYDPYTEDYCFRTPDGKTLFNFKTDSFVTYPDRPDSHYELDEETVKSAFAYIIADNYEYIKQYIEVKPCDNKLEVYYGPHKLSDGKDIYFVDEKAKPENHIEEVREDWAMACAVHEVVYGENNKYGIHNKYTIDADGFRFRIPDYFGEPSRFYATKGVKDNLFFIAPRMNEAWTKATPICYVNGSTIFISFDNLAKSCTDENHKEVQKDVINKTTVILGTYKDDVSARVYIVDRDAYYDEHKYINPFDDDNDKKNDFCVVYASNDSKDDVVLYDSKKENVPNAYCSKDYAVFLCDGLIKFVAADAVSKEENIDKKFKIADAYDFTSSKYLDDYLPDMNSKSAIDFKKYMLNRYTYIRGVNRIKGENQRIRGNGERLFPDVGDSDNTDEFLSRQY